MQKGGQALLERMDEHMRHLLRAGAELKHRQHLRQRINGQPEPEHPRMAAQPGTQQWSNWRWGICRVWKQRPCKVCACEPSRVSHEVMLA